MELRNYSLTAHEKEWVGPQTVGCRGLGCRLPWIRLSLRITAVQLKKSGEVAKKSEDTDVYVPRWLSDHTLLGVELLIVPSIEEFSFSNRAA